MTHKPGLCYCLQYELRDFLCFFSRFFLTSNSLLLFPARIYKQVPDSGDSLRGVAILTKIFLAQLIFAAKEVQS
ncbi:hypothetical protein FJR06_07895 [Dolichospermum sp. UHCC 0352]|nr:hypothetical protein [Dolichospermum sp. UHCC 0352]